MIPCVSRQLVKDLTSGPCNPSGPGLPLSPEGPFGPLGPAGPFSPLGPYERGVENYLSNLVECWELLCFKF